MLSSCISVSPLNCFLTHCRSVQDVLDLDRFATFVAFSFFLLFQNWDPFCLFVSSISLKTFFGVDLLLTSSLFCLSENVFISFLFLKDVLTGDRILGWQLSFHWILVFIIAIEKSAVSLTFAFFESNQSLNFSYCIFCIWFFLKFPRLFKTIFYSLHSFLSLFYISWNALSLVFYDLSW